jgi:23S rRNA pseudouridine2604 synthase
LNGVIAVKGNRVAEGDVVLLNGKPLRSNPKRIYIAFHKPRGLTCTTDLRDKSNVVSYINHTQRIFPIGRLDKDSEGLIFLTNDGDIVNKILRSRNGHEKEYIVVVDKPLAPDFVRRMSNGIPILGTTTKQCAVEKKGQTTFRIILTQGLNRQIRRMCEYMGYEVKKLKRIRIMSMKLDDLAVGKWRYFTETEMKEIEELLEESTNSYE